MDKRHFREVFRESNSKHIITVHKGSVFYVGCIDSYRVTGLCPTLDDCLGKCREVLNDMPDWLRKLVGEK